MICLINLIQTLRIISSCPHYEMPFIFWKNHICYKNLDKFGLFALFLHIYEHTLKFIFRDLRMNFEVDPSQWGKMLKKTLKDFFKLKSGKSEY
jgi:hypothetical protein